MITTLSFIVSRLPPWARRYLPEERQVKLEQFFRFGVIGLLGFIWDTLTFYTLRHILGDVAALLAAYLVAATLNWIGNRLWTFRGAGSHEHMVLQWLRFLGANSCGLLLNRGTVVILFLLFPVLREKLPFIALAAGAGAGMFANFSLSRRLIFRERAPQSPAELLHALEEGLPLSQKADSSPTAQRNSDSKEG